jgi:caspase domain-containing protein/papain like protease/uncharacterized protein DUF4384
LNYWFGPLKTNEALSSECEVAMQGRWGAVLAAIAVAGTGMFGGMTGPWAQSPDASGPTRPDPVDTIYTTGALPNDPEIERSLPMSQPHRAFLPVAVDLTSRMPKVGNQGASSSCVAWSTAYAARSYYTYTAERRNINEPANLPSPSYVYHLARQGKCEAGTTFARVAGVLNKGALSLAEAPFTDKCQDPSGPDLVAKAHDFRIRGLIKVDYNQPNNIKGQLARSNPVLIDFHTSAAFHKIRNADVFTEPGPPPDDKRAGWHGMAVIGYDDQRQAFRLQNSWGTGWGDHGYAWIGYDALKSRLRGAYVLDTGPLRPQIVTPLPAPPVTPPKPVPVVRPPVTPPVVTPPVVTPPPAVAPVVRGGVALIIGNTNYAGGKIATATADADVMAETMRGAGYKVTELYDTRKSEIGGVMRDFLDQVAATGPDSVAFVYFTGYAAQAGGKNYLVPSNAEIAGVNDVAQQALPLDDLVAELAKLPAAARIIVLDAAYEHGYGRGKPDLVPPGLASVTAPAGMVIAFPAAPGRIAAVDAGPYSLYTATLVRQMRQSGVDYARMFKATGDEVDKLSQGAETPWTAGELPAHIALFPAVVPEVKPVPVSPLQPQPVPVVQPPAPAPVTPVPGLQLSDLKSLACGAVKAEAQGGQTVLSGYVASDDDLNRVKVIAASVPNIALGNVVVAPWPQCEALQTLEKPLSIADRPSVDIGPSATLHEGDLLKIQVRSPGQISYLYVSYIQADGSVVHLVQPNALVPQPTLPNQTLTFGSGEDSKPKYRVSAPYGREMIIAIASRSPLFDHELPQQQTERDYLTELRRALIYKPDPVMPDRELAATMTTLQTAAR